VGESEGGRQRAEFAVGHHVADQPASQRQGVDGGVRQSFPAGRLEGVVEEGEVEADIVTDYHAAAEEFEERREHLTDTGGISHHGIADSGESGDEGRNPLVRSHECLVGGNHFASAIASGRYLGQ
jgi:hypothetical protein